MTLTLKHSIFFSILNLTFKALLLNISIQCFNKDRKVDLCKITRWLVHTYNFYIQ